MSLKSLQFSSVCLPNLFGVACYDINCHTATHTERLNPSELSSLKFSTTFNILHRGQRSTTRLWHRQWCWRAFRIVLKDTKDERIFPASSSGPPHLCCLILIYQPCSCLITAPVEKQAYPPLPSTPDFIIAPFLCAHPLWQPPLAVTIRLGLLGLLSLT